MTTKTQTKSKTQTKKLTPSAKPKKTVAKPKTKKQICIEMLKRPKGASVAELQKAIGWQAHSVRGFLSGTIRKLDGIALVSEQTERGERRYRVQPKVAS